MLRWKIVHHDGLLLRRFIERFDLNLDVLLDLRFLIRRHTSSTEYLRVVVVDFIDFVFLLCCCFARKSVISFEMDCKNVS